MTHNNLFNRIYSVWYRHVRVYSRHLLTNGLPPFLEPLIFLGAISLGIGRYIKTMEGLAYTQFLASGLLVTSAMYTAAFECSFGTFLRLNYEKTYDGMLAAPITVRELLIGEILWAGTKGLFFSAAVLSVISLFGVLSIKTCFLAPIVGFLTGLIFASISLLVTSFVTDLNQFNFYFTGFISPMFFLSGVVFSLKGLPKIIFVLSELCPLTHSVRLVRACCFNTIPNTIALD